MAHWFHRNVLKATTNQKFEFKITNSTDATRELCSRLVYWDSKSNTFTFLYKYIK